MRGKLFLMLFLGLIQFCGAQPDSSMKFDLGIARGQNVRLWPVLRVRKGPGYRNTEVFFSAYQRKFDRNAFEKHSHLFPLYFSDSNITRRDLRLVSLYYPSVFHYQHAFDDSIRSYRLMEFAPGISLAEVTNTTDGLFVKNNAFLFLWYKNDRRNNSSYFVFFPLYWYFQQEERKFQSVFPVYWHLKKEGVNNHIVFPIAWRFKNDRYQSFTLIPLLSVGKNPTRQKSHLAVTPLYWQFRDSLSTRQLLFPLFWHKDFNETRYKRKRRDTVFYHYHQTVTRVFPLVHYTKTEDFKDTTTSFSFVPLFWKTRSREINHTTLFPIYWSREYKNQKKTKVLFPLLWKFETPYYRSFTLIPLFSYGHDVKGRHTSLWVFPTVRIERDSDYRRESAWPFFKHTLSEPFSSDGFHQRTEETQVMLFYQLRRSVSENDTEITLNAFPYFYKRRNRLYETTTVFPVFYRKETPFNTSVLIAPVYFHQKSKTRNRELTALTPLIWLSKNETITRKTLFPIYWSKSGYFGSDSSFKQNFTLFPIWFSRVRLGADTQKMRMLFPLCLKLDNWNGHYRSFTLMPFFSKGYSERSGKSHFAITPFYWQLQSEYQQWRILFPLYWYRVKNYNLTNPTTNHVLFPLIFSTRNDRKHRFVIFPLYWYNKQDAVLKYTLFPLYFNHRRYNDHRVVVFPFYFYKKSRGWDNNISIAHTAFPFVWKRELRDSSGALYYSSLNVFPVFWGRRSDSASRKFIFPLFYFYKDKKEINRALMITPLIWSVNHWDYCFRLTFPFYMKYRKEPVPGGESRFVTSITPFYWQWGNPRFTKTLYFPLASKTEFANGNLNYRFLWFVFRQEKTSTRTSTHVLGPLLGITRDERFFKAHLAPLVWYKKSWDADRRNPELSLVVFPLLWLNQSDSFNRTSLLPLYYFSENKRSGRSLAMITPLIWLGQTPKTKTRLFLPIYFRYFRDSSWRQSNLDLRAFTPFYWTKTDRWDKQKVLFPLYWHKIRDYSSVNPTVTHFFLPLFFNARNQTMQRTVLFPVYWYLKKDSLTKHTVFPLLYHTRNGQNNRLVLFPLYWQNRSNDYKKRLLLPVFYSSYSRPELKKFSTVALLYWDLKKPEYSFKVAFPLYMHYKGGDSAQNNVRLVRAITPFYWYVEDSLRKFNLLFPLLTTSRYYRGEKRSSVLGIVYRHQRTATRNSFQLLWPLVDYTRDTNLTYAHLVPFVWYKKSPRRSYFSIQPLFYTGTNKENRITQVLWQLVNVRTTPLKKTTGIFFHAVHSEKYKNGDHAFRIIYLLYADVHKNGFVEKSFFPFYYLNRDSTGNTYFNSAFAFYSRSSRQVKDSGYFYKEERLFWILRYRSNYKYLKAKGVINSRRDLR